MSPSDIEVLIHYHCCPAPHPRIEASAVKEITESYLYHGLIEANQNERFKDGYKTTDKGAAHVEQLCKLPWPVKAWTDQNGKLI